MLSKIPYSSILIILFSLSVLIVDIFGFKSASNAISTYTWNRLISPLYPSADTSEVVILLINDSFFEMAQIPKEEKRWPLKYKTQADLIKRVLDYKPKAFYLGLNYSFDHSSEGSKFSHIRNILINFGEKRGVVTYLPDMEYINANGNYVTYPNSPKEQASGLNFTTAHWQGNKDLYPLVIDKETDRKSVALSIYQSLREKEHSNFSSFDYKEPMVVQWGAYPAENINHVLKVEEGLCIEKPPLHMMIDILFSDAIYNFSSSLGKTRRLYQPCPYITTLPAQYFFYYNTNKKQGKDPELTARLSKLIKNKVVMIGADINGVNDSIISPLHQKLPGIHLHAMALDNLIKNNKNYVKRKEIWSTLTEVLFFILVISLAYIGRHWSTTKKIICFICFVALTIFVIFIFYKLKIEAYNWIGLMAVSAFLFTKLFNNNNQASKAEAHG